MTDHSDAKLRAILVGVGGYGQVWRGLDSSVVPVRPAALVDSNAEALKAAGEAMGVSQRFATLKEAVSALAADIVIDSTPPQFHLDHAFTAFENGLHLFTAKPMAATWREAVQMVQAAEAAHVVLGVNEQFRFGWLPLAVAHAIQMGDIGTVESIEVDFRESSAWEGWRSEMEHPLLLDAAVQHFDMVRAITGLEVESAFCHSWRRQRSGFLGHGSALALLQLTGGVPLSYRGTWDAPPDSATGWWGDWRIMGSAGSLRAEGKHGLWLNGVLSSTPAESLDVRRLSLVALDQFVRSVRLGESHASDGAGDLLTLAMSELCIRSAASGKVEWAEDLYRANGLNPSEESAGLPTEWTG